MAKENILEILDGAEITESSKERIIIYARAGTGKTRFALSVPEDWGKLAYYAADDNSWLLQSISRKKRDRVKIVRPRGPDPMSLFMQFCMMNWDEEDSEVGAIVVDTYTKVAMDCLSFSANTLSMDREKHYVIGDIGKGGIAIPNRGDYQGLDGLSKEFLSTLFKLQRDRHIIFICHEESKQLAEGAPFSGGPQHPGRQMIDYLPGQFSTVIRLIREEVLVPGEDDVRPVVVAITENDGKFVAKVRTEDEEAPNPIARRVLDRDPSAWWTEYMSSRAEQQQQPKKKKTKK